MPGPRLGELAAFSETFECVHAHGLEEAPPISDRGSLANDEALVDESTDDVTDDFDRISLATRDRRRRREIEPAHEDREPPEQRPFVVVEQVVTPLDHRPQRTVAFRVLTPTRQELKAIVESGEQARRCRATHCARAASSIARGIPSSRAHSSATTCSS